MLKAILTDSDFRVLVVVLAATLAFLIAGAVLLWKRTRFSWMM